MASEMKNGSGYSSSVQAGLNRSAYRDLMNAAKALREAAKTKGDPKGDKYYDTLTKEFLKISLGLKTDIDDFFKDLGDNYKDNADDIKSLLDDYLITKQALEDRNRERLSEVFNNSVAEISRSISTISNNIDASIQRVVEQQESLKYWVDGTGTELEDISKNITNALNNDFYVKQETVFNSLRDLIESGIMYNTEQRAYLSALSKDLNMTFNAQDGSLTRLINIQRTDLSSNRVAIEYSLKEFLNQNYQTSQYIKEGFTSVSQSLVEAQSLMNANSAMQLEASIQTWLGSYSSVGMTTGTTTNIGSALGKLGAGDISVLNSPEGILLAMGAARSGLSIADLLLNGLEANTADTLMTGITEYIKEISATSANNVVKSEYGKIFGLNVSDIQAVSQLQTPGFANSGVTTDISGLLGNLSDYVNLANKVKNSTDNIQFSIAQSIGTSGTLYTMYEGIKAAADVASRVLQGVEVSLGPVTANLSDVIQAGRLATTLAMGAVGKNGLWWPSGDSAELGRSAFEALGTNGLGAGGETQRITSSGILGNYSTETGLTSSGQIIFNESSMDIARASKSAMMDNTNGIIEADEYKYSEDDIYKLLVEKLLDPPIATETRISPAANTVVIGNDLSVITDAMYLTAVNTRGILDLLIHKFANGEDNYNPYYDAEGNETGMISAAFDWLYENRTIEA